jgi:hypothetical protein
MTDPKTIFQMICGFVLCLFGITNSACRSDWEDIEVEPLYPAEGWDITDFALSFRWKHQIDSKRGEYRDFELQVDDNKNFSSPEIDVVQTSPKTTYRDAKDTFERWTQISYMPSKLLSEGTYYWRVRLEGSEEWSKKVSFTINEDHSAGEMIRDISPTSPLFSFDMFFDMGNEGVVTELPDIYEGFPTSVQPYVAFALHNEPIGAHPRFDDGYRGTFTDFLEQFSEDEVPILIKTGGPDKDFQQFAELSELEYIFKTQPNVIGMLQGETFWDFIDAAYYDDFKKHVLWYQRSLQLARKYGRIVVFGNGNDEDFVWDTFLGEESSNNIWMPPESIQEASANIIPTAKNNIPFGYYHAESAVMGSWLSGQSDQWGVWSEGWAWGSIGYDGLFESQTIGNANDPDFSTMPYNLWLQMKLAALSQGATFYHFGGESSVVEWGTYDPSTGHFVIDDDEVLKQSTAFWDMDGNEHPSLQRYIIPFMEAVIEQELIPSKEEVLSKVKVAVASPSPETNKGSAMDYGVYAELYKYTLGIDDYQSIEEVESEDEDADYYELIPNACRRELLHNEGRYYMTPILPYPITSLSDDTEIVDIDDISAGSQVRNIFDNAYPEADMGDAWVVEIGQRLYINNSHENKNISQSFSIALEGIGDLSGTVQPHSYIVGKYDSDSLWLMANADNKGNYTDDRTTKISLTLSQEPTVEGGGEHTYSNGKLEISLDHSQGHKEVQIHF